MSKSGVACYRNGGCGPYEMYSCSECPASKSDYMQFKRKPITNYDRIRAMDIDHLIEWYCRGRPCGTCPYNGVECGIRDWLKQEAGK